MTEEEKKDEMKNRIGMALKDPILQQGFEIICKNLAELEKENAELKADNDARKFAMAMSEKVEKQLREKNAELMSEFRICEKNADTYYDQLTKAKDIIKELIKYDIPTLDYEQAEQFLKEIEK